MKEHSYYRDYSKAQQAAIDLRSIGHVVVITGGLDFVGDGVVRWGLWIN